MNLRNMNCTSQLKFKQIAILVPAAAKRLHANAQTEIEKHENTTICIRNSGFSFNLKV